MSSTSAESRTAWRPSKALQMETAFAIHIPAVDNSEEYKFLPGHFAIDRVLEVNSTDGKSTYTVKLQSGERETSPSLADRSYLAQMSYSQLSNMDNGPQSLSEFKEGSESNEESDSSDNEIESSDDEIQIVGARRFSRHPFPSTDGAASENGTEMQSSRSSSSRGLLRHATTGGYTQFYDPMDLEDSDSDDVTPVYGLRRFRRERLNTARISSRQRKSLRKNLRERLEDDLSDYEPVAKTQQQEKFSGAREFFYQRPPGDEFREWHCLYCSVCKTYDDHPEKGPLVFCQGCTSSYHQSCLGLRSARKHLVTKIHDGFILQCHRCLGVDNERHDVCPHLGYCAGCKQGGPMSKPLRERLTSQEEQQLRIENGGIDPITAVNMSMVNSKSIESILFRCVECHRGFHLHHLLKQGKSVAERDNIEALFAQFSVHWQCKDCSDAPGDVETIVAWRPANPKNSKALSGRLVELVPEIDKEYLVKWRKMSYFRATWVRGDWLWGVTFHTTRQKFFNKFPRPISNAEKAIPEEFLRVDIVFDVVYSEAATMPDDKTDPSMVERAYVKYKGLAYEDSVWESPPLPFEAQWDDFKLAFNDWMYQDTIRPPPEMEDCLSQLRTQDFETSLLLDSQPKLMTGVGDLMGYQLDGVNWLYYKFLQQKNCILADDMGLGKTIQAIGLFATLIEHSCWPFLVVAPNSTCQNWRREIKAWAPKIRVVTYYGSSNARQMAWDYEMFPDGKELRCHVVIASYESIIYDGAKIDKIKWAGLVVDEGQRLKNAKSLLYKRLHHMPPKLGFRALLTGTPLQNNIRELFNLVQFLDTSRNAGQLEQQYGDLTSDNIRALHDMIRPFFLRRTKAEVLPFLPPMVQIIVPVSMSTVQKKLYKSILSKSPELIKAICQKSQLKKSERQNLNNILMQLRKCLCHPFVYSRNIEEQTLHYDPVVSHRHLVEASGKLQLLGLMLPKLRERAHRVLIFSQFLENLDIVEDFLDGLGNEYKYRRLDGSLSSLQKQAQIDDFNASDSPYFAFLLSTRSGGVGINLASADTVIIMDPDFNPKQDIQALSRAHRIGQKNTVLVFHLVTRDTVEERIMQKGKTKLALDHVLIERIENEDEENLESILRHGAETLFSNVSADITYTSDSIDRLLDRSQAEQADKIAQDTTTTDHSQFNFARVWQNDRGTLEAITEGEETPVDTTFWDQILQERELAAAKEAQEKVEGLGRGKRKRAAVNYSTKDELIDLPPVKQQKTGDADQEFELEEDEDEAEESESSEIEAVPEIIDLTESDRPPLQVKPRLFVPVQSPKAPIPSKLPIPTENNTNATHRPACIVCSQKHLGGRCPLKLAGVQNCPLCGLAHFGERRSCPHLLSPTQIRRMMAALSKSTEAPVLLDLAWKYLRGVMGHLNARERKAAGAVAAQHHHNQTSQSPVPVNLSVDRFFASQSPVFQHVTTGLTTAKQDRPHKIYTSPYFAPACQAPASKPHSPPSSFPAEKEV
ncbi:hypothetical protein N7510_009135 [Penicillium lagena]|uniref:uncharacterized protein n=1 Tax=Penicillium lagena TaxID=94218 RepID=UPI002541F557|nr:uncharacterized protein N7510_009135 [Penicillium lagena]KAJ5606354.1 hypothetical protein N7510_009135 [Penicillium lagena]